MPKRFETHGDFGWTELQTNDPEGAKKFYSELFGWEMEEVPMPTGSYTVVKTAGERVGGIMAMPPGVPAGTPPYWGAYVTVDDVDAVASKVTELGGTMLVPPMDIPNVGRFCVFKDKQGACLSAMTYKMER